METPPEYMDIFQVTPKMGIIYVNNPELLLTSPFRKLHLELTTNSSLFPIFTNLTVSPVSSKWKNCLW